MCCMFVRLHGLSEGIGYTQWVMPMLSLRLLSEISLSICVLSIRTPGGFDHSAQPFAARLCDFLGFR